MIQGRNNLKKRDNSEGWKEDEQIAETPNIR